MFWYFQGKAEARDMFSDLLNLYHFLDKFWLLIVENNASEQSFQVPVN